MRDDAAQFAGAPLAGIDNFDEESCRYFLREVGEQIVPFYPFAFGIDEVYSILVDRYGPDGVADALGVLQELLEFEDNASGLGDDGDIWRSWRHGWRHRNDDPLNPCIPKVHGFVLPVPTPTADRLTRTANFSVMSTKFESIRRLDKANEISNEENLRLPSPLSLNSHGDNGACSTSYSQPLPDTGAGKEVDFTPHLESISRAHKIGTDCDIGQGAEAGGAWEGKTNLKARIEDFPSEDADSEQEFDEVRQWANTIDFDGSQLISFEIFRPSSSPQHSAAGLRGGGPEICTLRPVRTPTPTSNSPLFAVQHSTRSSPKAAHQTYDNAITAGNECLHEAGLEGLAKMPDRCFTVGAGPFGARNDSRADWSSVPLTENFPGRVHSVGVSRTLTAQRSMSARQGPVTQTLETTNNGNCRGDRSTLPIQPLRRSSTNREARLIDGAIFTPKIPEIVEPVLDRVDGNAGEVECRKSSVRTSWSGVRQKHHSQHSWMHSVRAIFQKDCQYKQSQNYSHKRVTIKNPNIAEQSHSTDMYPSHETSSNCAFALSKPYDRNNLRLALDGTCDDPPPPSPVNLNKALPPQPMIPRINKPPSSRAATLSFDHSQDTTDRPSIASTASSGISASSCKREYHNLHQLLVQEDMIGGLPAELSPVRNTSVVHGPHIFDQPRSAKSEYSEFSFTSVVNGNPFTVDTVPLTPKMPLPLSTRRQDTAKSIKGRGLPQSRSEPTFPPSTSKRADYPIPSYLSPAPVRKSPHRDEVDSSTARGRSPHQPPAPPQFQQSVSEDQIFASKGKPRKRSRSPVKKLLGFGKSSSLKNVASELQHHPNEMSPEKRELKTWGNRLRHGFLSSETEPDPQVEQTPSSKLTRSTKSTVSPPQHSTFPVSLDPPYQAKILSEIELMICVTANRYLMHEYKAGRLSAGSVAKTNDHWARKNRPQVIEFSYDQSTQRELVLANLNTIKIHGESAENAVVFNTTMYNWNSLAKEMAIRTFCSPDSAIRKHMHDAHKILETLGAPLVTFLAFQDLQVKTLGKMADKQRERMERDIQQHTPGKRVDTPVFKLGHTPKVSQGTIESSPSPSFSKAYDTYEKSRGGRLGMMVRDMSN